MADLSDALKNKLITLEGLAAFKAKLDTTTSGLDTRVQALEDDLKSTGATGSKLAAVVEESAANKTAIDTLNGTSAGSVSKTVGDAIDALNLATTYAGKAYEGKVDTLETTVGDSTSGLVKDVNGLKTTVGDSTSGLVKKVADLEAATGADGLAKDVAANTAAIAKLNGAATEDGSVAKAVADGIASVVAEAPEKFDTLKDIADWIGADTTGAATMQSDIATLKTTVGDAESGLVKDVAALKAAVGKGSDIDGRLDALETFQAKAEGAATVAGSIAEAKKAGDDAAAALDAFKSTLAANTVTAGTNASATDTSSIKVSVTTTDGKVSGVTAGLDIASANDINAIFA